MKEMLAALKQQKTLIKNKQSPPIYQFKISQNSISRNIFPIQEIKQNQK